MRTTLRSTTTLLTLLTLLLWAEPSRADEFHYRNVLIGDRALGMGGAFTAISDDPSAAYYNPAGLALISNSSVSASLQVNSIEERVVTDAFSGVGGLSADFRHSADPSVPVFVSLLKKFGKKDANRQRHHAFGLSTFHPDRRTLNYSVALNAPAADDSSVRIFEDYRVRHEDATSWFGPSYAYAASDDFALGISAFLATRTMQHSEELTQVNARVGSPNPADTDFFAVQDTRITLDSRHIVLRLGTLMTLASVWQLGVMLQPPGIELSSEASVTARTIYADTLSPPPQYARSSQTVSAASPIPWEIRVGGAYVHPDPALELKVGLDVTVHGPSGSTNDKVQAIGSPQPDPVFANTPWLGNFLVQQYVRKMTFNVALGGETTVAGIVPIRAGVFTNMSAARDVRARSFEYTPDDVDQYGASLAVGLRTGGYDLSIGGAAMIGRGHGLRTLSTTSEDLTNGSYGRTTVTDRTLVFFITGYRQALSKAARAAYDEL